MSICSVSLSWVNQIVPPNPLSHRITFLETGYATIPPNPLSPPHHIPGYATIPPNPLSPPHHIPTTPPSPIGSWSMGGAHSNTNNNDCNTAQRARPRNIKQHLIGLPGARDVCSLYLSTWFSINFKSLLLGYKHDSTPYLTVVLCWEVETFCGHSGSNSCPSHDRKHPDWVFRRMLGCPSHSLLSWNKTMHHCSKHWEKWLLVVVVIWTQMNQATPHRFIWILHCSRKRRGWSYPPTQPDFPELLRFPGPSPADTRQPAAAGWRWCGSLCSLCWVFYSRGTLRALTRSHVRSVSRRFLEKHKLVRLYEFTSSRRGLNTHSSTTSRSSGLRCQHRPWVLARVGSVFSMVES